MFFMLSNKKILTVSVIATGIVMAIIRILLILANIEKDTLDSSVYFLDDNAAVYSFAAVTAVLCILFFVASYFAGRSRGICIFSTSPACSVASVICGFALLGEAVIAFTSFLGPLTKATAFDIALLILTLGSAVYFFYAGFCGQNTNNSSVIASFALLPIAFAIVRILSDFIQQSAIPLASSGAYHIISLLALMMFLLCDGKLRAGYGGAVAFQFFGHCAILLLMIYAIPNLFLHSYWVMDFDHVTAFSVVDACFAIYIAVKIICTEYGEKNSLHEKDEDPSVDAPIDSPAE